MNHYPTKGIFLLILACVVLALPAGASLNTISAGDTVFIGEQGLDITGAAGASTQIAWFPSTAQTTATVPEKVIDLTGVKNNFYVNPIDFSTRTGNWYRMPIPPGGVGTATLAFRVVDPYLALKVEDTTVNVDVTGKWAPTKDTLGFRIETNLYTMSQRVGGGAGAPLTIKVQTPEGNVLTALIDSAGTAHSLDIRVTTSPFMTAGIWDTGNALYPPGTYEVWIECNENHMKDNYNQPGKTVSEHPSLLVQDQNPLINPKVTVTTTAVRTTITQTTTPTTVTTTQAPATSSAVTTAPVSSPTNTETPSPLPTPTKAVGFCGWCAMLAAAVTCAAYVSAKR
jgi:Domain of unknown function (DUF3821)